MSYVESAAEGFWDYVREGMPKDSLDNCTSVEQVILHWVMYGDAVADCSFNYHLYLSAIADIFAQWHDGRWVEGKETAIPDSIVRARAKRSDRIYGEIFDPYTFVVYDKWKRNR
ncbi:hypothetical protein [Kibdelosporangium aridum]|uniref:Uncharacterized protein n=1 Tax=Kibdelosporangium aridum TaxID=2030 RepID=A0A1Y5XV00_KIBAR|nr:hypothetical protein [Kibdelosporangium aridum]SMD14533.1 hypothetical protein SAMN05661093_05063 [Kibdelosporangium aridum]